MASNQHLLFINQRLRQLFLAQELFAGHSIIFVGDFWQLPPVGSGFIFFTIKKKYFISGSFSLWENFHFHELDEVMRQAGDPAFASVLNRLKIGVMTNDDIAIMKSREISAFNQPPLDVVRLFLQRREFKNTMTRL